MSVQIFGTLGPSCADAATLARMIGAGMTGIRLNLSHTTLREAKPYLDAVRAAERETGRSIGLLLDMIENDRKKHGAENGAIPKCSF